jgi:hypothetical protein
MLDLLVRSRVQLISKLILSLCIHRKVVAGIFSESKFPNVLFPEGYCSRNGNKKKNQNNAILTKLTYIC